MLKKMSSIVMLCFCGAVLTSSMLCGQNSDKGTHVIVGSRALSTTESAAPNTDSAEKSALIAEEKSGKDHVDQNSQAEATERVTQHDMFYTSHPGAFHSCYSVGIFGDTIEFEDGSVWTIYPRDAYKTLNWLASDLVVVTPNRSWFSTYNFRLTNQNTGESVESNLTLGPLYNGPFTHWIVAIDYYNNVVCLEDGTIWNMSGFDDSAIKKWIVNDTVIIGINDGWLSYNKPNILINVNMLNYARCIVGYTGDRFFP